MGTEDFDIIAGVQNDGEQDIDTNELLNYFCQHRIFGREVYLKIALVAGGLLVYTKDDSEELVYDLCFGIPNAGRIQDFYFAVSA